MSAWFAPAKINLFLHVVGRRADGYHLLQTVFRFLDYGDVLHIDVRSDGQIVHANPLPGVPAENDLIVRAARKLQAASGMRLGATLRIDKRLPMGGGLGGGSSDAATALIALNRLWDLGFSNEALQAIGLELGADVPIFIHGHSAFAEGVGEQFSDVGLPPAVYLVIVPPVGVPTAAIFGSADLRRDTPLLKAEEWRSGMGHNDLEPVACRLFPEVAAAMDMLRAAAPDAPVRMSGSGACVFAELADIEAAQAAQARLPVGAKSFTAAGLDVHPLHAQVAA